MKLKGRVYLITERTDTLLRGHENADAGSYKGKLCIQNFRKGNV